MKKDCAVIVLAAGGSSRLGQPKQLLLWQGKTLIEHTVDEASLFHPAVVVTGANAENVSTVLQDRNVMLVRNETWQQGMASGIVKGLRAAISAYGGLKAVILAVCDQPFVSAALFETLVRQKNVTGKGIVASRYAGTVGTPVLFTEKYFDALTSLQGAEGAKSLLRTYKQDLATVAFAQGAVDIDTELDYRALQNTDERT